MPYQLSEVPPHIRHQVADFIEFLLQKYPSSESVAAGSYRERLMQVSVWSEAEVKAMADAEDYLNQWKPASW